MTWDGDIAGPVSRAILTVLVLIFFLEWIFEKLNNWHPVLLISSIKATDLTCFSLKRSQFLMNKVIFFFKGLVPFSPCKVLWWRFSEHQIGFHFQEYLNSVTRARVLLCLECSIRHMPKASIASVFLSLYESLRNSWIFQVVENIAASDSSSRKMKGAWCNGSQLLLPAGLFFPKPHNEI